MAKPRTWIEKAGNSIEQYVNRLGGEGKKIICASGISPSGSIHLGNLREIFTVHLLVEELLKRGHDAEHLHFWDDYDRLRKIPANVPDSFSEHIGKALSDIPDPFGKEVSYGMHFMKEFEGQVEKIGIKPTYIRQSEVYKAGKYTEDIKEAMLKRHEIFDIMLKYINPDKQAEVAKTRENYYPFKVYDETTGKDDTTITAYDPETATITYTSESGPGGSYSLNDKVSGKLVWKVDWPMRWNHYGVIFEPGGVDHSTPGSSFTVGKDLIKNIMGSTAPFYIPYAFVSLAGSSTKISSSSGSVATPENALKVIEPAILRWLFIRTDAKKSFQIDFGQPIMRLYDEWDRLVKKNASGKASDKEQVIFRDCVKTSYKEIPYSVDAPSFKVLASSIEVTANKRSEVVRIVSQLTDNIPDETAFEEKAAYRYERASFWVEEFQADEEKMKIGEAFNDEVFDALSDEIKQAVGKVVEGLEANWTLDGLSTLLYGVPKQMLNHPLDQPPTPELKELQRDLFKAVYNLIVGEDTGPRLPSLFISLGIEKIRSLLSKGY